MPVNFKTKTVIAFVSSALIAPATASLIINENRVVFPASQAQTVVVKVDNPGDSDFLVQSWIESKNGQPQEDIFVDPPLAKIKAHHKISLRLTTINSQLANQKNEQLYWLNIKEIPHVSGSQDAPHLAIVIRSRIKVLYRPLAVDAHMNDAYTRLQWQHSANGIKIHNPTPYYITFNKVEDSLSAKRFAVDMISPGGDIIVPQTQSLNTKQLRYNIINDFGDTSEAVIARIN